MTDANIIGRIRTLAPTGGCIRIAKAVLGWVATLIGHIMSTKTDGAVIGHTNTLARTGGHTRTYNDTAAVLKGPCTPNTRRTDSSTGLPAERGDPRKSGKSGRVVRKFCAHSQEILAKNCSPKIS